MEDLIHVSCSVTRKDFVKILATPSTRASLALLAPQEIGR